MTLMIDLRSSGISISTASATTTRMQTKVSSRLTIRRALPAFSGCLR